MKATGKQKLWAAIAIAVVIVGVVVAIANSGGHSHKHSHTARAKQTPVGTIAVAANYLGMSRAEVRKAVAAHHTLAQIADSSEGKSAAGLIDALVAARSARLQVRASSHKLSSAEERAEIAALRKQLTAKVNGAPRSAAGAEALLVASHYLGVPTAELLSRRRAGHSLEQIASSTPGRSPAGLIDALVSARKRAIETALRAQRITRTQANLRLAELKARMTIEAERADKAHS
jgi:hypothetical protein